MKKNIVIVSVLLLCTVFATQMACSQIGEITGWDYYGLNGKVETVTSRLYSAKRINTKWQKEKLEGIREYYFNNAGEISKSLDYTSDGGIRTISKFTYKDNQIQKEVVFHEGDKKLAAEILVRKIDSNHKIIQTEGFYNLNIRENIKARKAEISDFFWDGKRITRKVSYREGSGLRLIESFVYNSRGQLTSEKDFFDYESKPNEQTIYHYEILEYDKYGNWIKRIKKNPYDKSQTLGDCEERIITYLTKVCLKNTF